MKKLLLLLSISFAYLFSFSQSNYQPATIVTINGESQTGEIDYRNWKENPSTISFRKDKSSQQISYGVADLESFSVSGDIYKRAILQLDERKDNLGHLEIGDSIILHTDTVFLLSIVSGPKSLYQYKDNVDHFYIPDGNGFELLQYKRYKMEAQVLNADAYYSASSQQYVATNKQYLTQLRTYLNDCSGFGDDIKYDLNGLRNIFLSYYLCLGTNPEHVQKEENEKMEIRVMAGASNTTFNVNTASNILGRIGFSPSTDFAAGAFFDLVFPRDRGRMSFNNELMYTSFKTEGGYREVSSSISTYDYIYNFEYSYLRLNTMLRYKFFLNNTIIFINGGFSNGFVVSEVNTLAKVHTFNGNKTTTYDKGYKNTKSHELGFLAGAGVRKNRASIEIRADKGNGPFRSSGYKASVIRYFALIGYRIK